MQRRSHWRVCRILPREASIWVFWSLGTKPSTGFARPSCQDPFLLSSSLPFRINPNLIYDNRRLHNPSAAAVTIGTAILEDTDFVAQFTAKSQQHLASTYAIVTATLNQEGIHYVKGV